MKKRFNTLNEEINRMKSLFTEERMFGNLVENEEVINESNLKVGSKGEGVKALQTLLGIESDGIFGPKTKEAVIKMQKESGLNADGIVGPKTLEGLKKKLSLNEDESDNLEDGNIDLLNIVSKEVTGKPIVKVSAGPGKDGFNADSDGDGVPDYLQKDNPQNKKGKTEPVKGPEGETSSTSTSKGDEGKTEPVKGPEGETSSTSTSKGDEEGEENEKGMPGTEAEGDSYDRGEKRDTIKGVLADIKADKGIINDNVSNCKKSIKMIYKQIKRVGSQDLNLDDGELKNLDWCVSTFKNRFGKSGFGVNAKEVSTIYRILKRPIPKFTGETVEKETYDVMMDKRKIAKVKMLGGRGGGNKFRFNGRKGFLITKKDRENDTQIINPKYEKYFLKSLGFGDDKEIVIIRSDGNNGTFTIN